MTPSAPTSLWQPVRVLAAALLFSILWALLCNLIVELLQVGGNFGQIASYTFDEGLLRFLLGSSIVWVVLLLLMSLTGRLWVSTAVLCAISVVIGFANYEKIRLRLEPLYPSDFEMADKVNFLGAMVGTRAIVLVCVFTALVVAAILLSGRVLGTVFPRIHRRDFPRIWVGLLILRGLGVVTCISALIYASHFNSPGNNVRAAYEASGAHWAFWYQKLNYQKNGFVGGLLYNTDVPAMREPTDYSKATMAALADRYSMAAEHDNAGLKPDRLDDVNVVMVLSEAFSDPEKLHGVTLSEDPIPFTRQLMTETTSGAMLAQLFGGGTANMEFEALTGFSLSQFRPQMNTPYQMLVPDYQEFPSAVGYFKAHGHRAIAIHPYMTSMYKREQVYPVLGFDEFIYDKTMQTSRELEKSDFISDESAFHEVTHQIQANEDPLFVNLVTMQNHYPMADLYAKPLPVIGVHGEAKDEAEGYSRGLNYTDEALKKFISALQSSDEKTVLIFYGDHLPAFWPEAIRDANGERAMKETPFFIWSNFATAKHSLMPTTSPTYFLKMALETVGAPLPPYYVLLDRLQEEIAAMEQGTYIDPDNNMLQQSELSTRAKQLLHDYQLVQYDLTVGERYSQDELFYPLSDDNAPGQARASN